MEAIGNTESRGEIGEESKGGKLPTGKENILDERLLSREARAAAGAGESPTEQAATHQYARVNIEERRVKQVETEETLQEMIELAAKTMEKALSVKQGGCC